jgi:gliding motility-associated-like protein
MKTQNKKMAKCVFVFLVLTLLILHPGISYSQFVVQNVSTPQSLVENVLLGNGVSVSNVSYTGSNLSLGSFSQGSSSILGLSSGIVLSTGKVTDLASANTVPNKQYNTQGGSDPQLQALTPLNSIYDAAVLEFDFIPTTDSVQFRFVFGSEEYAEWIGSNFNDVFGFFITGINPLGGQYTNKNIAVIPGTNTPISTNTINAGINNLGPCTNCNYYIDNTAGTTLQLDGLTTVMVAKIKVVPCQTYHIKIAIGDGADHSYDSGVFLEANSFSSIGLHVNSVAFNNSQNNIINEGCDSAAMDFVLSSPLSFDYNIPLTYTGTSQNGIDYQSLPDSVYIPAGTDSVRLYISPIIDNISEGNETLNCIVPISGCTNDTLSFVLSDYIPLSANIIGDSVYCKNDQISQSTSISGGKQPYNISWNSNNVNFVAQQDTNLSLLVTDGCGISFSASKNIEVNPVPNLVLTASIDSVCKGQTTTMKAFGADSYTWYKNNIIVQNNQSDSLLLPLNSATAVKVVGVNQFGCTSTSTRNLTVYAPMNLASSSTLNKICEGDTANFILSGASQYIWNNNGITYHNQNFSNVDIFTNQTDSFWVKAIDSYSCVDSIELTILVEQLPQINVQSSYDTICSNMVTTLSVSGGVNYQWWTNQNGFTSNGSNVNVNPSVSTDYYVKGSNIQGCSNIDSIHIEVYNKPNVNIKLPNSSGVCYGDSLKLSASGTNYYYWLYNGNIVGNNTNSIYFKPSNTSNISVVGVDVFGCSDTTDALVHVFPEFKIRLLDSIVCKGSDASLSTISSSNALNYIWDNGETSDIANYTILGPTQVVVTVTDTLGCQRSDSAIVNIFPEPNFNLYPATQSICVGDTATVYCDNIEVLGNYWWDYQGVSYPNLLDTISITPTSSTTVKLTGTDTNGCNVVASSSSNVIVNPLPNIVASPDYSEVQPMAPFNITVSGGVSYLWGPTAVILQAGANYFTAATDTLTHFYIKGTDANGCVNYDTAIVNPRPQLKIVTANRGICLGDSTYLDAVTNVLCSYQWNTGATTNGIWVKPNATTTYTVIVTDGLGYQNVDSISVIVYTKPTIMVNPFPVYVCQGSSTKIRAYGAKYFTWSPSNYLDRTTGSLVTTSTPVSTSYKIVGEDKFGCVDSIQIQVQVVPNAAIHISSNYFDICQGDSISISSTGASTYKWLPGKYLNDSTSSSVIATPDTTIQYRVVGFNAYGCSDTLSAKVQVKESPKVIVSDKVQHICAGDTAEITASGAKYYNWYPSTGLSNSSLPKVKANPNTTTIYTVVGTNQNGCKDSVLTKIGVHAYPNININPTNSQVCPNDSVVLTAIGASTYTWYPSTYLDTNRGNSVVSKPDTSVSYRIIGKSNYGCSDTVYTSLEVSPISVITSSKTIVCEGDTVFLSAYTNTNNVSFLWSNGSTNGQTFINPTHDTTIHLLTTNAIGCYNDTSVFIEVEQNPVVSVSSDNNFICKGDFANLHATGAILYRWSSDSNNVVLHGSDVSVYQNTANTYHVIGSTLLGCKDTASISVGINPAPTVSVSPNFSHICSGSSQLLTASGASNYSWYPNIGISTNQGDSVIVIPNTNMSYMVVGVDSNGCKDTAYANFVTWSPASISPSNPHLCYGDSVELKSITQNQVYSYQWSTGDTSSKVNVSPTQSTTYKVTITYGSGCSKVSNVNVIVHKDSSVIAQVITPQVCHGDTATLKAVNGVSFTWQGNGVINANDSVMQAKPSQNSWYRVTALSSHSCVSSDSVFVSMYNKPPINLISSSNGVCSGDSIQLTASGGNSYKWLSPNTSSTNSSIKISHNVSKKYRVIGYDYNMCRDTAEVFVKAHALPSFSLSPSNLSICPKDTLHLYLNGNSTYSWNNSPYLSILGNNDVNLFPVANTFYTLSAIDSLGCVNDTLLRCDVRREPISYYNIDSTVICVGDSIEVNAIGANNYIWSPQPYLANTLQDTVYYKPQLSGYYHITGISTDGCSKTDSIQIVVEQKPILTIATNKTKYCEGDSVVLVANCSNILSSFQWQNGDTSAVYRSLIDTINNFKLIGTSPLGCKDSTEVLFTVYNRPSISINAVDVTICQGDTISLFGIGDSSLYYTWSTGVHAQSTFDIPNTNTLYSLIAEDTNTCRDTAFSYVHVQSIPNIAINPSSNSICLNDSIMLSAVYSDSNLTFLWNTGSSNTQITEIPQSSILYSLTAIDTIGCSNNDSIFVTVNPAPQFSFIPSNPEICNGDSIILSIVSNNSNLNYLWGVGDTVNQINVYPSSSTNYSATVIDSNGCIKTDTVHLEVHPLPSVSIGIIPPVLCKGDTAVLEVAPDPSVIQFQWNTGDSSNIIKVNPISSSTYYVTVTDTNSCSNSALASVFVAPLPIINITSTDSVICTYDTIGLNVNSNIPLSNILWNNGQTTSFIIDAPITSTNYSVIGTDTNGCVGYDSNYVVVNQRPVCEILVDTFICQDEATKANYYGNATSNGIYHWSYEGSPIASGGGMGPVSLKWTQAGEYKVKLYVEDFACVSFPDSVYIKVNPLPIVDFEVKSNHNCDSTAVSFINNSFGMMNYRWNFGDPLSHADTSNLQNPSYVYSVPGIYDVNLELTTYAGCSASLTKNSIVEVLPKPYANFRVNTYKPDPNHPVVNFYNYSKDYTSLIWDFGESASGIYNSSSENNPYHIYLSEGVFYPNLIVGNDFGCYDTATTKIDIESGPTIYAPKAFTPNGDGLNETFKPLFSKDDVEEFEIFIYNRWGRLVYHSKDYHNGWSGVDDSKGDACEPDVYSYAVYITDSKDVKRKFTGAVTLLR